MRPVRTYLYPSLRRSGLKSAIARFVDIRASNDCLERPCFFESLQSLKQFANMFKNSIFPSFAISALPITSG